ncbi:MAG: hypothetical protein ACKO26_16910 [Planctomycetota bacterium]
MKKTEVIANQVAIEADLVARMINQLSESNQMAKQLEHKGTKKGQ